MSELLIRNKPLLFRNKDFHTILIKVFFPLIEDGSTIVKFELLPNLLNYMNNKYPTEELFLKAQKENFISSINCTGVRQGNNAFIVFNITVFDNYSIKNDYLAKQMDFFHHFIYDPLIEENGFNNFQFEREKKNLKLYIDNLNKNPYSYQNKRLRKLIDNDEGILSRDISDYLEQIDELTSQELYEFYQQLIINNQPMVYIFGNITEKEINDKITPYLYLKKFGEKKLSYRKNYFIEHNQKFREIYEDSFFKDSSLSFVYKVKHIKDKDILYLKLVSELLSSLSSRLLDNKLRTENNLVYSSHVSVYEIYGILEITTYLKKKDIEEVKKAIFSVINDLKNTELIDPLLNNIKERKRINLIRLLDDKYLLFSDLINGDLKYNDTYADEYKKICKITSDNISKFIDRLELDVIYFLKEDSLQ